MTSLALLALLALAPRQDAPASPQASWYTLTEGGQKAGWMKFLVEETSQDGEKRTVFTSEFVSTHPDRPGDAFSWKVTAATGAKPAVRAIEASWTLTRGGQTRRFRIDGKAEGGQLKYTRTADGERTEHTETWDREAIPNILFAYYYKNLEPGQRFTFTAFSVKPGQVELYPESQAHIISLDELELGGAAVKAFQVEFHTKEKFQYTGWVTPQGQLVKLTMPLPRGTAEFVLTDEKGAKGESQEKK